MGNNIIKKIQEEIKKENKKLEESNIKVKIVSANNEVVMSITKNKCINEVFILKIVSQFQIDILKNNVKIERGLFIVDLPIWIYNLYNSTKFLYKFVGGRLNGKTMDREEIDKIAIDKTDDMEEYRKNGEIVHRKELDNQPIVEGYLSPMFNGISYGIIHLRYETQEVYNMVSR